jgi:hypothetical protein
MLPDPGCYEERDRVTGRDGMGLAAGLLAIGLGFLWHTQAIFLVIGTVLATLTVIALARRQLAFRAGHAGILLAGEPDRLTARRGPGVLIPWAEVEQIILYSSEPVSRPRFTASESSAVQAAWKLASSPAGGWTATAWPPSPRRWRPMSASPVSPVRPGRE